MKQRYRLPALATCARPLLLAALLGGGAYLPAGAQALNYFAVNAQVTSTSYTDLGTTGTAIATPDFDDSNSAAQPLGFTFSYGGADYTQFVLNTNGYLKLGGTAPTAPYFSNGAQDATGGPLSGSDTNLLLPLNTDLEAGPNPTEYRVATTGAVGSRVTTIQWKNVSDKARAASLADPTAVPKQFATLNFQVRLYEGTNAIEFVYGSATASTFAATNTALNIGLKGNGTATNQATTVTKATGSSWNVRGFQDGGYVASTNGFSARSTVLPSSGLTFRFNAAIANDVALTTLYNIEQLPAGQSFIYRTQVVNKGTTTQAGLVATLTLAGANSATLTQTLSLAPGGSTVLTWPALTLANAGTTTVTATIPADATPSDNSQTATTITATSSATTPAVFSYLKPGVSVQGGYGFGPSTAPYLGACYAAYTLNSAFTFTFVRVQFGSSSTNVGQKVAGALADASGNVLGQSTDYTIQASDLGQLHTFILPRPVTVPAGVVLAGLLQPVTTLLFFPTGTQPELPGRTGTFYTFSNVFSFNRLTDINATGFVNLRFLIEAGNGGGALATASPELAQALAVFPNPSASGQFSLSLRGADAPAGLAVSVVNQLGQVVYTGLAPDNATTALNLSQLSAGIYYLQLRNNTSFTSRVLSIGR
jgi:hypothetical protein